MEPTPPRARRVVVLGRRPTLDIGAEVRGAAAEGSRLVLLSLGDPVTARQRRVIDEAMLLAVELRIWLEAVLTPTAAAVERELAPGEPVTLAVSHRERGRLRRATAGPPSDEDAASGALASPDDIEVPPRPGAIAPAAAADAEPDTIEALAGRDVADLVAEVAWTPDDAEAAKGAPLRVYLGAAPGVGKTYAMLSEGHRRRSRGTDVVVGVVQTYDRPATIEMARGLETVPLRSLAYRGRTFEEMDVEALVRRRPEVALIDELAHTNVPGTRRAKRWEDVVDVLAAGIEVITTVNTQHLASLNDVVARISGIRQQETLPDWVLDLADQIELIDMSPHALRRRIAHGNVYPDARRSELALQRFFTTENLTALRELALMRVANQVDDDLMRRWSKQGVPETRERILVCLSRPGISERLARRGSRIAQRTRGDLLALHVAAGEAPDPDWLDRTGRLVRELGGSFEVVQADDPVDAVLSFAYRQRVTQIVVGESLRTRWQELLGGSFVGRLLRRAKDIDVHVMAREER